MKTIKLSHLLFGLAVIAGLVVAAVPARSAFALSDPFTVTSITAADARSSGPAAGGLVCRSVIKWRNGQRVVVRVCHRAHRPDDSQ